MLGYTLSGFVSWVVRDVGIATFLREIHEENVLDIAMLQLDAGTRRKWVVLDRGGNHVHDLRSFPVQSRREDLKDLKITRRVKHNKWRISWSKWLIHVVFSPGESRAV